MPQETTNDDLTRLMEAAILQWEIAGNQRLENKFLNDAKVWAESASRGDKSPPPVAPMALDYQVVQTPVGPGVVRKDSTTPVSAVKPESFLPTYRTDTGAISGTIGGPIEGSPGKFYATASSNPQAGQVERVGTDTYVYQRPTPFGGFWLKL